MTPNMPSIVCLGVDPAPSGRGSDIAEFHVKNEEITPPNSRKQLKHRELRERLKTQNEACILLAWDAPLTGPYDLENAGANDYPYDFTKRPIERAFGGKRKPPKGISVQGYAGCQHWTITRNLLGLPRVGPFDQQGTPPLSFELIDTFPAEGDPPNKRMVVEVHPAMAIWLWVADDVGRDIRDLGIDLHYKKTPKKTPKETAGETRTNTRELREKIVKHLVSQWGKMNLCSVAEAAEKATYLVESDDALDAYVSGVLAALLASGNEAVKIFGNKKDNRE